ncbi:nuclear transport factor 2 family protein [Ruegeria arenilitoris]|uniref:nuclear transport factor 2 family protein n=1 Tax=Ruegeria arenilitoris TaxID=1173585 RepID=UPI00147B9720|nr:nuclear transport factor 2 family protein [Ruegeria arenilitoris]
MTNNASRNKDAVRAFFKALEAEEPRTIAALFAEDGVHINPYHSGVFPTGAEGRAGIEAYWTPTFPNFDGMTFAIHELCAMEGDAVFVRFSGKIKLKNYAGWYNNDYYSTFKFNAAGEITEYVEIFNPVVAARGFGLMDQLAGQD